MCIQWYKVLVWGSIVLFFAGCQSGASDPELVKNTPVASRHTPNVQFDDALIKETVIPDETESPLFSESSHPDPATETPPLDSTAVFAPLSTMAGNFGRFVFGEDIAFIGRQNPEANFNIGVFYAQTNTVEIVVQSATNLSFGRALWSPQKNMLAFAQLDSNTPTYSLQIYNQPDQSNRHLEIIQPQVLDGDGIMPGLFLFGWSEDEEWLAYDYTYNAERLDPKIMYLLNALTMENVSVEVPNPEGYLWFSWSPYDSTFAIINGESVFVGNAQTPDQLMIYPGEDYLGLIAWHPFQNKIMVGSSNNMAAEGINQLQQIDLDTGEWIPVDSYDHIAGIAYSPDGRYIAVHSQHFDLRRLIIVDAITFEVIQQIELPSERLSSLEWSNNSLMSLTSKDNIFIVPVDIQAEPYWVFDENNPLYKSFYQVNITDW